MEIKVEENLKYIDSDSTGVFEVVRKTRGRPSKPIDPVKKASFAAALASVDEGVSSSHLAKVTGFSKTEVMAMLKSLIKEGKVVKTGQKKGSKYGNAKF